MITRVSPARSKELSISNIRWGESATQRPPPPATQSRPPSSPAKRGSGYELVVVAGVRRLTRLQRVAGLEGGLDLLDEARGVVLAEHASNQQAAVAENPGSQDLGGQLLGCDPGELPVAVGELIEGGLGVVGPAGGCVQQLDAGRMAERDQAGLRVRVALLAVRAGQLLDLSDQLLGAPPAATSAAEPPRAAVGAGFLA